MSTNELSKVIHLDPEAARDNSEIGEIVNAEKSEKRRLTTTMNNSCASHSTISENRGISDSGTRKPDCGTIPTQNTSEQLNIESESETARLQTANHQIGENFPSIPFKLLKYLQNSFFRNGKGNDIFLLF